MEDTYGLPIWVGVELKHAGEGCGAVLGAERVFSCCRSYAVWCLTPQLLFCDVLIVIYFLFRF